MTSPIRGCTLLCILLLFFFKASGVFDTLTGRRSFLGICIHTVVSSTLGSLTSQAQGGLRLDNHELIGLFKPGTWE